MASYKCPRCGESYDSSMKECPVCGFETGAYTVETFFGQEPKKKSHSGHNKKKSTAKRAVPIICALVLAASVCYGVLFFMYIKPMDSYSFAVKKMLAGDYVTAEESFNEVPNFRDSKVLAQQCADKIAADEAEKAAQAKLEKDYAKAVKLMEDGSYQKAIDAFAELGDYADCTALSAQCEKKLHEEAYNKALALLEEGNLNDALLTFAEAKGYGDAEQYCTQLTAILEKSDELADVKAGDILAYGVLEQDGNAQNGAEPIEWYVLENDGETIKLLSRYILLARSFNKKAVNTSWAECSLRDYLNTTFLETSFDEIEQTLIYEKKSSPDPNPRFTGVDQGNASPDKVTILNYTEFDKLQKDHPEFLTTEPVKNVEGGRNWWLRTMGSARTKAVFVNPRTVSDVGGCQVDTSTWGVRPVITLKLY